MEGQRKRGEQKGDENAEAEEDEEEEEEEEEGKEEQGEEEEEKEEKKEKERRSVARPTMGNWQLMHTLSLSPSLLHSHSLSQCGPELQVSTSRAQLATLFIDAESLRVGGGHVRR